MLVDIAQTEIVLLHHVQLLANVVEQVLRLAPSLIKNNYMFCFQILNKNINKKKIFLNLIIIIIIIIKSMTTG